jgi:phosphohistidine phosphatase
MQRLLLMRHAKAETEPKRRDAQRPLNARGRKDAALTGAYMARHGLTPDGVFVSTALRTRQTWELLAKEFPAPAASNFDERLYGASPDAILDIIREAPRKLGRVLVIGHNPAFHALAAGLVGAGDIDMRRRLNEKFPTAALAVIDFAGDDWGKLRAGTGRIVHFVSPRTLAAATE